MTVDMEHLLNAAIEAVRRGMNIALHPPVELDVHTKANRNDLVTAVDKAIEADIASHLHAVTGLPLLGEEGHAVDSFAGLVWVLDPIDGTLNYVENVGRRVRLRQLALRTVSADRRADRW